MKLTYTTHFGPVQVLFHVLRHCILTNSQGHANFHNAQTMSLSIFLAVVTFWQVWFPTGQDGLLMTSVLASGYFITQLTAMLFPGSTGWDPPQKASMAFPQVFIVGPFLGAVVLAYSLEQWRLMAAGELKIK